MIVVKNIIIPIVSSFILIGCAGRPPAPVDNFERGSQQIRHNSSNSTQRPPLPGKRQKSGNPVNPRTIEKLPSISSSTVTLTGQEIFKKCNSAVFMVFTSTGYQGFQGSGFFISPDGLAVSNYHVFKGTGIGWETIKLSDGKEYKLEKVLFKDEANDVIIFTIKNPAGSKFNYIPLSSRVPQVGDKAYAIGSPRGLENTFSSGEISQFRNGNLIQISVPIDHGSSGGALINEYGEAIGITSAGLDDSGANLNFAVNINVVRQRIGQL